MTALGLLVFLRGPLSAYSAALCIFAGLVADYLLQRHYRRMLTEPLKDIEGAVASLRDDLDGAEPIDLRFSGDLKPLAEGINSLLYGYQTAAREAYDEKEEIHALNEELEASLEQIIATEQEVSRQKMFFEALFRNSSDAIVLVDQDHLVQDINRRFEELFGYTLSEIQGQELDGIIAGNDRITEANGLRDRLLHGEEVNIESIRYGKGGRPLEVSVKGVPILYQNWANGGYGIYSDISVRKSQERALTYYNSHDPMTGLFNRRYFEDRVEGLKQADTGLGAVIMADFNGLKLTNDAFGPAAGDAQLRAFAGLLLEEGGKEAVAARLDGDDFAVLLPEGNEAQAEAVVQRIRARCEAPQFESIPISVSFGYAGVEQCEGSLEGALHLAEAFMNRHKLTEASSARSKAIQTVIRTLHEKNRREEQHSQRVSILSRALGEALGLSEREQRELKTMGLLHDVGKIAIDEKILNKTDRLTPEEYAEIRRHPEIGYHILSASNDMAELAEYVLAHHERWDGQGYPRGLKGEEIPYLSRIIAVVDAYDAMTRDRAYRKAMSDADALEELKRHAGTQFDPYVVAVFLQRPDVRNSDTVQQDSEESAG